MAANLGSSAVGSQLLQLGIFSEIDGSQRGRKYVNKEFVETTALKAVTRQRLVKAQQIEGKIVMCCSKLRSV
jgi:hypothetical protein